MNKPKLHPSHFLLAILTVFTLLWGIYTLLIPPFEGPDEAHHLAYVMWLAQGNGLPPQGKAAWDTPLAQEAAQPPFYYWLAAIPARLAGNDPPTIYRPNPHFAPPLPDAIQDNKNVALHYLTDTRPLQGGWLALYLARGVSFFFGLVLIISIYGLVQSVTDDSSVALVAAGLVAATPQVIFHSSLVSNDITAAAMSTLTLWLLARLLHQGVSVPRALMLGGVFGLALLSKVSVLALGPALVWGLVWLRASDRSSLRTTIVAALCLGGSATLVAGWWYGRSWFLYGSPLGLNTHCYAPWAYCDQPRWTEFGRRWHWVFDSYWTALGWGNIKFPDGVYDLWLALVLLAVAGLVWGVGRWWRQKRPFTPTTIMLALLTITLLCQMAAHESWMHQVGSAYGRLLFPSIGAVTTLLVVGWRSLHSRIGYGLALFPWVLALLTPGLLLVPAYLPPQPLTPVQMAALGEAAGWRFGDFAELISITPKEPSVLAGDILPVQVCWRTLARADHNYTLFLRLVGPNNQIVTGRFTYPGLGSYPTSQWQPDQAFCDVIHLNIPADLAQTLLYEFEIGWLDDTTAERLPVTDAAGNGLATTFISAVRLIAIQKPIPEPPGETTIRLVSHDFPVTWYPGQAYDLVLRWWLAVPVSEDYTLFIHLRQKDSESIVAQADGPPLDGWYPTSWWVSGEEIVDTHTFLLPPDVPAGEYDLVAGWYDPTTGQRFDGDYYLGEIEVRP